MATETTNYGLTKPGYSDTADVADINENMDKIDGVLNYVSDAIGIVVDGDKTAYADGVEIGQFVILRNSTITGCDDGLYKAAKTIPYNTVIDSTYLTAEPSGAANALNASLVGFPDYANKVTITSYNSSSNNYTANQNGWVYVRVQGGRAAIAELFDNDMNVYAPSGERNSLLVPVAKGSSFHVSGTPLNAYFIPMLFNT